MAGRWCAERQNHDYGASLAHVRLSGTDHPPTLTGQRCSVPTYAQGPPPERPVQHPHLRPGAIDRPREARYSSPFGDPLCNTSTGRWTGFVGQNPRPCGVPPGHLPTASLEGCVSQDLSPCRPPVQHPHGCSRPVVLFRMRNIRQGHRCSIPTDAYSCLIRRT